MSRDVNFEMVELDMRGVIPSFEYKEWGYHYQNRMPKSEKNAANSLI